MTHAWQDLEGLGRPRVSDETVAAFVANKFGLAVTTISRLTGERDLNFRVCTVGASYVVKVANASESKAQLECEHAAMLHVACQSVREGEDSPLQTPMPLELCSGGGTIASIVADDGKQPPAQYLIRVLTFIEGSMWSSAELAPDFVASLGRAAARLDSALLSFSHPAAAREHAWDLGACQSTVRAYLSDIGAEEDRALVLHFAALHEREVEPLLRTRAMPRSVVHQDLNDNNVVCAGGHVRGVIDFGDMSLTETCNNLAVALAYAFFGTPRPLDVLAEAVRGYSELRRLSACELGALYPLACMRVCTTVVMAAHSVRLDPDNAEYLTISQAPAWEALRVLHAVDPLHAAAIALKAGGAHNSDGQLGPGQDAR